MKTSILVARAFRILSVLAFVIILFLSYVSLPPDIAVHYDLTGRPDVFITKSELFYGLTAFVVIFNIAFSVLATLIPAIPVGRLSPFNRDFWLQHRQVFRDIFTSWMLGFIGLINLFLIVFLVVIRLLNTAEDAQVFNYRWVVIVGGIVLLGWLTFLPIRLMIRSAAVAEE